MDRRLSGWPVVVLATCGSAMAARAQATVATAPATVAPPASLRADGIPAIPAAMAETVGAYTEFRSAAFAGWHPTRRAALILTRFGDTNQVHEVSMPGGARRQLTFYPERITSASWPRRSADDFVFTGDRDVYVVDPRDPSTTRRLLELKGGGWDALDWSPDESKLVVLEFVSINESYLWIADVATGEHRYLTTDLPWDVASPRPVVINIHGGPESQSRPTFLGRSNYLLDQLGVAILYPNVRGSTGFGKTIAKLDNGRLRENTVQDIGALLDWLRSRADLDASRVLVTGGSYGGCMTLAAATRFDGRIRGKGGPVWHLLAEDEGHGFARKRNQDYLFYATVAFMQAYLLN